MHSLNISSMASTAYQRLKHDDQDDPSDLRDKLLGRLRRKRSFHVRRRLRIRIPNFKRFFTRKRKLVKTAWTKVCTRLKESQSHLGQLFAGNYLFMQVTPTPQIKSYARGATARRLYY